MKRLPTLFIVLGVVACGTRLTTAQEVLTNGNMDAVDPAGTWQLGATPTDWIAVARRGADLAYLDGAASEGFANHNSGGTSGLFFKAFTGNPPWDPTAGSVDADVYQDNPGTPGMKYILTGWAGAEANYSGLNMPGEQSFFAIDFLGAGGVPLSSAVLGLEAAGLGGPDPSLNYEQFSVSAIAPIGTETVRARVSMEDGVFFQDPGQAFVADEFSLTCVPEPTSVVLLGLSLIGLAGIRRRG